MRIALDYDDTFTGDSILWEEFIDRCKERGHSITFVTFRMEDRTKNAYIADNTDILEDAERLKIDVVFTNGMPKRNCFKADIWIDDKPETITTDYEQLHKDGVFIPK